MNGVATDTGQNLLVIFTGIGGIGSLIAAAIFLRAAQARRRDEQRNHETLWGFKDSNGVVHDGVIKRFLAHLDSATLHGRRG